MDSVNNKIATVLISAECALYLKQKLSVQDGQFRKLSNREFSTLRRIERFLQSVGEPVKARHKEIVDEILAEFPDLEETAPEADRQARVQTRELALSQKLKTDDKMFQIQTESRELTLSENDFEVLRDMFEEGTYSEHDLKYTGIIDFFLEVVFSDLSDTYVITLTEYHLLKEEDGDQ